jgi:S1-C subfamily serine protease
MQQMKTTFVTHAVYFLIAAICLLPNSNAEDLITTDGKIFKNLKITKDEPGTIKVIHDNGISVIPKALIPAAFLTAHELSAPPIDPAVKDQDESKQLLKAFAAQFPTITTKDGKTYPSNQVTALEPSGLKIISPSGVLRVKYIDLPERYKVALKYDPLKAAEYERNMEKVRLESSESIQRESNAASVVDAVAVNVRLSLIQNVGKGWICSANEVANVDEHVVTSRPSSSLTGPSTIREVHTRSSLQEVGNLGRIVVFGLSMYGTLPEHLQQTRSWKGKIFFCGKSEITTVGGKHETLKVAQLDRNTAIKMVAANGIGQVYSPEGDPIRADSGTGVFAASGTGFGISEDGYIATAAHVVEGASEIRVLIKNEHRPAVVTAIDQKNDVAILKVKSATNALVVKPTSSLVLGQDLFTIGFPLIDVLGTEPKFTKGNVTGLEGGSDDGGVIKSESAFQISAPIQPGNSGGPVCAKDGGVIGIVRSVLRRGQNVNFASKSDALIELTKTVPDVKLSHANTGESPENAVLDATYLISVTGKN